MEIEATVFIDRFALGMRIPREKMAGGPEGCMELLLSSFDRYDLSGLKLLGGEVGDMFIAVIMGGGLGCMRTVYRRIQNNAGLQAILADSLPVIENNRLAKLPELEYYGMVNENGEFEGGNSCFGLHVK